MLGRWMSRIVELRVLDLFLLYSLSVALRILQRWCCVAHQKGLLSVNLDGYTMKSTNQDMFFQYGSKQRT